MMKLIGAAALLAVGSTQVRAAEMMTIAAAAAGGGGRLTITDFTDRG